MARANGLDNMSYADLLTFKRRSPPPSSRARPKTPRRLKIAGAYAEKAGFRLEELFGKRGSKGSGVAKYRNPKDASQTWTGRGRKPNWLVDAVKKGAKMSLRI